MWTLDRLSSSSIIYAKTKVYCAKKKFRIVCKFHSIVHLLDTLKNAHHFVLVIGVKKEPFCFFCWHGSENIWNTKSGKKKHLFLHHSNILAVCWFCSCPPTFTDVFLSIIISFSDLLKYSNISSCFQSLSGAY